MFTYMCIELIHLIVFKYKYFHLNISGTIAPVYKDVCKNKTIMSRVRAVMVTFCALFCDARAHLIKTFIQRISSRFQFYYSIYNKLIDISRLNLGCVFVAFCFLQSIHIYFVLNFEYFWVKCICRARAYYREVQFLYRILCMDRW